MPSRLTAVEPEVAILGADQKERGLWEGEWLPELSIPAAGQKDRGLWGREWTLTEILFFPNLVWLFLVL